MATRVEDLILPIDADSRALKRELAATESRNRATTTAIRRQWNSASSGIDRLGKRLKGARVAIAAVGTALAAGAIGGQTRRFEDLADSIDKVSQRLGVSAKFLQENRFAAEQAGVGANTFDLALQRLIRRSGEAAVGAGEARGALRELGVEVVDSSGRLRSSEAIFEDSIRALARIEDATLRTAAAQKLFDSEGVSLVQLASSYDVLIARARELGVAIDEGAIRKLVDTKDASAQLGAQIDRDLAPSMANLARLSLLVKRGFGDLLNTVSPFLSNVLLDASNPSEFFNLENAGQALGRTRAEIARITSEIERVRDSPQFKALFAIDPETARNTFLTKLRDDLFEAEERATALRERIAEIGAESDRQASRSAEAISPSSFAPVDKKETAAAKELARAQRELNAFIEAGLEPAERLSEAFRQIQVDYDAGRISADDLARAQASLEKQSAALAEKTTENVRTFVDELDSLSTNLLDNFSDTLAQMLITGEGTFKELAASFAQDFIAASIRTYLTSGLVGLSSGQGLSGFLFGAGAPAGAVSSISAPAAPSPIALPVSAVSAMAAPGPQVAVNVSTPEGTTAQVSERQGPRGQREIDVLITDAVARDIAAGGTVARAVNAMTGTRPRGA